MCGLWGGMSSSLTPDERAFINGLGYLSQFRGKDSTGVFAYTRGKKNQNYYHIHRDVQPVSEFLESEGYDYIISQMPFLIAGHSRAATIGSVIRENAHPFHVGNIIGMHNGTIRGLIAPKSDRTDSEVIMEMLNEATPDQVGEVVKELDSHAGAAYALVWNDLRDNSINFLRNGGRTLYLMRGMGGCVFWSSERSMLSFMEARQAHTYRFDETMALPVGLQIKVRIGTTGMHSINHLPPEKKEEPPKQVGHFSPRIVDDGKPKLCPISANKFPYVDSQHLRVNKEDDKITADSFIVAGTSNTTAQTSVTTPIGIADKSLTSIANRIIKQTSTRILDIVYEGFLRKPFKLDFIERQLEKGCDSCGSKSEIHDRVGWISYETHLCSDCIIDPTIMNQYPTQIYEGRLLIPKESKN